MELILTEKELKKELYKIAIWAGLGGACFGYGTKAVIDLMRNNELYILNPFYKEKPTKIDTAKKDSYRFNQ